MQRYVIHRLTTSNRQKLKFLPHISKLASNWTIRFSARVFGFKIMNKKLQGALWVAVLKGVSLVFPDAISLLHRHNNKPGRKWRNGGKSFLAGLETLAHKTCRQEPFGGRVCSHSESLARASSLKARTGTMGYAP